MRLRASNLRNHEFDGRAWHQGNDLMFHPRLSCSARRRPSSVAVTCEQLLGLALAMRPTRACQEAAGHSALERLAPPMALQSLGAPGEAPAGPLRCRGCPVVSLPGRAF